MIRPLNRYLTVERVEQQKSETTVILPEDVVLDKPAFCTVKLASASPGSSLDSGMLLVAPRHMIEEVVINDATHYLILESSIVGYVEEDE